MHKSLALKESCIHNEIPFFLIVNKQYQARPVTAVVIFTQNKQYQARPVTVAVIFKQL
jgi:hypothetical protein